MVRAWFMSSDGQGDQRSPHRPGDCQEVSLQQLAELGVLYWKLDADNYDSDSAYADIKTGRGYVYTDVITVSPQTLPNYEEKIKSFFEEHLHEYEEIRFILEGSGYFDVRNHEDRWIRIEVNYIKAVRLFKGEPVWTPINRPADSHPARLEYLQQQQLK